MTFICLLMKIKDKKRVLRIVFKNFSVSSIRTCKNQNLLHQITSKKILTYSFGLSGVRYCTLLKTDLSNPACEQIEMSFTAEVIGFIQRLFQGKIHWMLLKKKTFLVEK